MGETQTPNQTSRRLWSASKRRPRWLTRAAIGVVAALIAAGTAAAVQTASDVTPPTVHNITLDIDTVDITNGPATVTPIFDATDDISGVSSISAIWTSPSGNQRATGTSNPTHGQIVIPQYAETGTWTLTSIDTHDLAGNTAFLYSGEIANLGFTPPTIEVTGTGDVTPPTVLNITLDAAIVDVANGPATITPTFDATDDLSGVSSISAIWTSPSGNQRATGTSNPTHGQIFIPQYAETGTWTLTSMDTHDLAGNTAFLYFSPTSTEDSGSSSTGNYGSSSGSYGSYGSGSYGSYGSYSSSLGGYESLGFVPPTIEVTSTGDVTPPTVHNITLDPTVVNVANGPATVTPSFDATDDISGVSSISAIWTSPSGNQQVSGTSNPTHGQIFIPQYAETGTWTLTSIDTHDLAGNTAFLYSGEIANLGFTPPTIEVTGIPLGDVNCSGDVTLTDALFIAQFSVVLRTDGGQCPLADPSSQLVVANGDVDASGVTDLTDALFIAQCAVQLSNVLCP